MTGEKNRYKTVERLWELDDKTLKTPKHDEMVLWLLDPENVIKAIPKIKEICNMEIKKGFFDGYEPLKNIQGLPIEHIYNGDTWDQIEKQYTWHSDFGKSECRDKFSKLEKVYSEYKTKSPKLLIESEVPITSYKNFIVGYWDIVISFTNLNEPKTVYRGYDGDYIEIKSIYGDEIEPREYDSFYIEVKPKIDSFGATLRQLKTYQEHVRKSKEHTYLFTEDLRFKEAFESQGIKVISPPEIQSTLI